MILCTSTPSGRVLLFVVRRILSLLSGRCSSGLATIHVVGAVARRPNLLQLPIAALDILVLLDPPPRSSCTVDWLWLRLIVFLSSSVRVRIHVDRLFTNVVLRA